MGKYWWIIGSLILLFSVQTGMLSAESYQTIVVSTWVPIFAGAVLWQAIHQKSP